MLPLSLCSQSPPHSTAASFPDMISHGSPYLLPALGRSLYKGHSMKAGIWVIAPSSGLGTSFPNSQIQIPQRSLAVPSWEETLGVPGGPQSWSLSCLRVGQLQTCRMPWNHFLPISRKKQRLSSWNVFCVNVPWSPLVLSSAWCVGQWQGT